MQRIRELRLEKGWTQEKAAIEIGVSVDCIKSIESGRSSPSLRTALKMARAFRCNSVEELLIV